MRLTAASIAKLSMPEGRDDIIYWDDGLPGFGLRIRAGGARTWLVQYRAGSKKIRRQKIGDAARVRLEDARNEARQLLAKVQLGGDPQGEKLQNRQEVELFGRHAQRYLTQVSQARTKPKSHTERLRHITRDWRIFNDVPIQEIGRRQIAIRLGEIAECHGPVAANRSRSTLSAFFSWAMGEGLVEVNPIIGTNKQGEERARDRVLSWEEIVAVWSALGEDHHASIVRLLLLTGQRRQEVAGMEWSEIHLDEAMWKLPADRTKNGRPHEVPLSHQAIRIVDHLERRTDRANVFGFGVGPFSGFSRCKARFDQRCGVRNWTLHDLRRTVVTGMNELGIAPHVVEAVVNHVGGHRAGVAGVYNRAKYADEKRIALQKWADHLDVVVGDRGCKQ